MLLLEKLVLLYLSLAVLYLTVLSISGHFYRPLIPKSNPLKKRYAVLVPGYKEDLIIINVVKQLINLSYPRHLFDVVIIADSFKPESIQVLSQLPIILLQPTFEKSSKAKSLNFAFNKLSESYDAVVILDADNIVKSDFLNHINECLQDNVRALQAQRVAKNMDSSFSILDACSEAINNHIFRKGQNAIGLSASLIGSGMAFEYQTLKKILAKIESVYEDREIQFSLAEAEIKIQYAEGILVYDEKIDNPASFQNQRRRWLYAQFMSLIDYFKPGHKMLFKGNFSYYNFTILNNLFPPRLILLGILVILPVLATILSSSLVIYWWVLAFTFFICLIIAIPKKLFSKKLALALFSLPLAFIKMIQAFFKMKGANKFIHTVHTKVDVDGAFKND